MSRESFENILSALNSLYKKADDILFEVETLGTEIREMLKKEGASALAEEALVEETSNAPEEKKAAGELELW